VNTAHEHKAGTPRAEPVARLLRQLPDRAFAGGDAFARENGWQITKTTGRLGFGAAVTATPSSACARRQLSLAWEYTRRGFNARSG
jgi:hypothetical protein